VESEIGAKGVEHEAVRRAFRPRFVIGSLDAADKFFHLFLFMPVTRTVYACLIRGGVT
jgi:hypothetical protein